MPSAIPSIPALARRAWNRLPAAIERHPLATRWALGGPGAILAAVATMAAMPLWLPAGAAGVNDIALPIVLAPVIWAVPFFYACLAENLAHAALAMTAATLVQGFAALAALS